MIAGWLAYAALALVPTVQVEWPSRSGFDISIYLDSCQFEGDWPVAGRSDVRLAIYHDGDRPLLAVSSADWTNRPEEDFELELFLGDFRYTAQATGLPTSAYRNGFSVVVSDQFLTDFAAARALLIERGDVVVAHLGLRDTGVGIADLRACVREMQRRAAAQAAREARVDYIARDPFAGTVEDESAPSPVRPPLNTDPSWARSPEPEFPERAAQRGISTASVRLSCAVEPNGSVTDCNVLGESQPGAGFAQAAIRAVRSARLSPRTVDSIALGGRVHFTVPFGP